MSAEDGGLERFVRGDADPGRFPHREHVRMAFELLRRHDFAESVLLYSRALRAMTARVGKPEVFNQTATIAFLALIGERLAAEPDADFERFQRTNPDVFEKSILGRWYAPQRLGSATARHTFLLPEPAGNS